MKTDQPEPAGTMGRRTFAKWVIGVGAFSSLAMMLAVARSLRPLQRTTPAEEQVAAGDKLVFALGLNEGKVITRKSIELARATLAFPQGKEDNHNNLILLLHLDPAQLHPPTDIKDSPEGFVAYSAICTHLGCTVNFSHEPMAGAPFPHLHCPCHEGMYDATRGARVIAGPPPRPLPELPLKINGQGELLAAGPFNAPVGVI